MAKPKKPIADKILAAVGREILERTRVELPAELVRQVVEREPELRREVLASGGTLDTEVRELFLETLAQMVAGTSWPMIGDSKEWGAKALTSIRAALEARGGVIHPPPPVTELSFDVRVLDDGVRIVVARGRIDGSNYTAFPEKLLRALAGKKGSWSGYRLVLDFGTVEWADADHALYGLTTASQNIRFYQGRLVAIGVAEPIVRRLEELLPKLAPETVPILAGSSEEAVRALRS